LQNERRKEIDEKKKIEKRQKHRLEDLKKWDSKQQRIATLLKIEGEGGARLNVVDPLMDKERKRREKKQRTWEELVRKVEEKKRAHRECRHEADRGSSADGSHNVVIPVDHIDHHVDLSHADDHKLPAIQSKDLKRGKVALSLAWPRPSRKTSPSSNTSSMLSPQCRIHKAKNVYASGKQKRKVFTTAEEQKRGILIDRVSRLKRFPSRRALHDVLVQADLEEPALVSNPWARGSSSKDDPRMEQHGGESDDAMAQYTFSPTPRRSFYPSFQVVTKSKYSTDPVTRGIYRWDEYDVTGDAKTLPDVHREKGTRSALSHISRLQKKGKSHIRAKGKREGAVSSLGFGTYYSRTVS
jgi:hypothetical protein